MLSQKFRPYSSIHRSRREGIETEEKIKGESKMDSNSLNSATGTSSISLFTDAYDTCLVTKPTLRNVDLSLPYDASKWSRETSSVNLHPAPSFSRDVSSSLRPSLFSSC